MEVLVLTSCVASKKYGIAEIKPLLDKHNLPIPTDDLENERKYKEILKEFVLPASQMYEGSFKFVKELVNTLRKRGDEVDFFIISARYGLIDENTPIIPYECTFKGLNKDEIRAKAERLKIYEKVLEKLQEKTYDLAIFILGKDYLFTIFDKKTGKDFLKFLKTRKAIFFGSKELKGQINFPSGEFELIPVSGIGDR
ncbi:MAG TPA: hypothetical protein ENG34_00730, partial [Candidatus Aenigmarchaeota archaeon]|nr:hypothetical protein [Candidatus Aenigmarchaeota archaeon]